MFATNLIEIMNALVDEIEEKEGLSPDQATIACVGTSLHALATALAEQAWIQLGEGIDEPTAMVSLSPQFIHGLVDTVLWMNDRLETSRL